MLPLNIGQPQNKLSLQRRHICHAIHHRLVKNSARAVRAPMTVVTRLSTREPVLPETDQFGLEDA